MSLDTHQQLYELIKNSEQPLITFRKDHNPDIIAASLALSLLLKKLGKKHEIVAHKFEVPETLNFLPKLENITQNLTDLRKLVIQLDITENKIKKFSYNIKDNKLNIFITPEKNTLSPEKISSKHDKFKYDLIFTLNTSDLESLDHLYHKNTDFFFETPIINIDHANDNENYGQLNLINLTATSVSEIIYDFIEKLDNTLMDEQIATCLLTGMITKTKSFRSHLVTPKSLTIASELMAAGAEREKIIQNIYQTKSVNVLKLWGRVLQNLKTNDSQKIAWSTVAKKDFIETNTKTSQILNIIDEMITNIPSIELTALFYKNTDNETKAIIKAEKPINLLEQLKEFQPYGQKQLVKILFKDSPLAQTPEKLIPHLEKLV